MTIKLAINGFGRIGRPPVSVDFNHDPRSSIFATDQTRLTEGGMFRILSWYDNERGFSIHMLDIAAAMMRAA